MPGHAPSSLGAALRSLAIPLLCYLVAAGSAVALASDEPSPSPPGASASPAVATPVASPSLELPPDNVPAGLFPLPTSIMSTPPDIPTVSVDPTSEPGLVVGVAYPFTLQHCGLLSPFDADGSLWRPLAGRDAEGGPIDSDDEIGELINATPGELTLTAPDQAEFVTITGRVIALQRAPGALDYLLCM
jgi:hypothetical protein